MYNNLGIVQNLKPSPAKLMSDLKGPVSSDSERNEALLLLASIWSLNEMNGVKP